MAPIPIGAASLRRPGDPESTSTSIASTVHVGGILLFENGLPHDEAAPQAGEYLKNADVRIDVSLGTGGGAGATIWTCDLSAEYVRINGEYRS